MSNPEVAHVVSEILRTSPRNGLCDEWFAHSIALWHSSAVDYDVAAIDIEFVGNGTVTVKITMQPWSEMNPIYMEMR